MTKEEILELFRITDEKVAQIQEDSERKIAVSEAKVADAEAKIADTKLRIANAEAKIADAEAKIAASEAKIASSKERIAASEAQIAADSAKSRQYEKEIKKILRQVSQNIGGISKSMGDIAEEYFYRALKGNPYIGQIHFDKVLFDQRYGHKQYDIIMVNEEYVALVSVKTTIKEQAVINLVEFDLPALKDFYSQIRVYESAKYIGVVAGLNCRERALSKANELGIVILTQSEDKGAKVVNEEVTPAVF